MVSPFPLWNPGIFQASPKIQQLCGRQLSPRPVREKLSRGTKDTDIWADHLLPYEQLEQLA